MKIKIKDYKQFLADGGEIRYRDGSIVIEVHEWADGEISVKYQDFAKSEYGNASFTKYLVFDKRSFAKYHTFRAHRERVSTPILVWDDGYISFAHSSNASHEIITEKQEDGSWKIIETILKPNA